jgi:calpain
MSLSDFMLQFDRVAVNKVFPENWEVYSIEGEWSGKTNGGRCPTNLNQLGDKTFAIGEKTHFEQHMVSQPKNFMLETKDKANKLAEHIQFESDDRWFNNPQFKIKVNKDTKLYISLMQED